MAPTIASQMDTMKIALGGQGRGNGSRSVVSQRDAPDSASENIYTESDSLGGYKSLFNQRGLDFDPEHGSGAVFKNWLIRLHVVGTTEGIFMIFMSNNECSGKAAQGRTLSFRIRIVMGILVVLIPMAASAQATTIYVQPKFLYNDFGRYSTPFRDTPQQAFADVQAIEDVTINGTTYTDLNLRPAPAGTTHTFDYSFDGFPYIYYYDQTQCPQVGNCNYTTDAGAGRTHTRAPQDSAPGLTIAKMSPH